MRSFAVVLCSLSLALAAPCQGRLAFPTGFGPFVAAFEYRGQPNAVCVMAYAFATGTTTVVLGPGLQCTLGVSPAFVVIPLGRTDPNGLLAGTVFNPSGSYAWMQVVSLAAPPATPALGVSNLVQWQFLGSAGCGTSSG